MLIKNLQDQVISALCYDLGIEHSMRVILKILQQFIPAEYFIVYLFSTRHNYAFQLVEISATNRLLDKIRAEGVDIVKELSPYRSAEFLNDDVYIIGELQDLPGLRRYFSAATFRDQHSLLVLKFFQKGDISFCLSCRTKKPYSYTLEHARLLHSLKHVFIHLFQDIIINMDIEGRGSRLSHISLSDEGDFALLANCPGLHQEVRQIRRVADTDAPVIILGETGVGKELAAGAIHNLSYRKGRPLVRVNCGAIPETLVDAEFFGYERGAFTGAIAAHTGYFEQANGGTLFLDEVGELSLLAQTHLLRVLETHEVRRIGSTKNISLDFRVVTATNRDLRDMVEEGAFRADLWYRLYGVMIEIPPLRGRVADIPVLLHHFMRQMAPKLGLEQAPACGSRLQQHLMARPWRGNVRELRNWVMRALIHTAGENASMLQPPPDDRLHERKKPDIPQLPPREKPMTLKEMEAFYISWALEQCQGRIQGAGGAAVLLDLHPATLRSKMRKLGIPLPGRSA